MQFRSREHESKGPAAEGAVHDFERVDAHLRLAVGVPCMKVWEAVIVEVHRDHDPEEAADSRHAWMVSRVPVVSRSGMGAAGSNQRPLACQTKEGSADPLICSALGLTARSRVGPRTGGGESAARLPLPAGDCGQCATMPTCL